MNIVISYTTKEKELLVLLAEQVKKTTTPIERASHRIHLFNSRPNDLAEISAIFTGMGFMVKSHPVPERSLPWPAGPNFAFRLVAQAMEPLGDYWYFLEPDHCPIRTGWLSALQDSIDAAIKAHKREELPIIGTMQDTGMSAGGENLRHVNGAALYPPNTHSRFASVLSWCPDQMPWDAYCPMNSNEWRLSMQDEPAIHLAWRSKNPKMTASGIKYTLVRDKERTETIPQYAMIVHGFKNRDIFDAVNGTVKRGRPKKAEATTETPQTSLPKKRGRPKKNT